MWWIEYIGKAFRTRFSNIWKMSIIVLYWSKPTLWKLLAFFDLVIYSLNIYNNNANVTSRQTLFHYTLQQQQPTVYILNIEIKLLLENSNTNVYVFHSWNYHLSRLHGFILTNTPKLLAGIIVVVAVAVTDNVVVFMSVLVFVVVQLSYDLRSILAQSGVYSWQHKETWTNNMFLLSTLFLCYKWIKSSFFANTFIAYEMLIFGRRNMKYCFVDYFWFFSPAKPQNHLHRNQCIIKNIYIATNQHIEQKKTREFDSYDGA